MLWGTSGMKMHTKLWHENTELRGIVNSQKDELQYRNDRLRFLTRHSIILATTIIFFGDIS